MCLDLPIGNKCGLRVHVSTAKFVGNTRTIPILILLSAELCDYLTSKTEWVREMESFSKKIQLTHVILKKYVKLGKISAQVNALTS